MLGNQEVETMSRADMCALQTEKLNKLLKWLYEKSVFYHTALEAADFVSGQSFSLDDLAKLPFTTRKDLEDNYPYGLLTLPLSAVTRVHTVGRDFPVAAIYTGGDIAKWLEMLARILISGGLNSTSILQILAGYGLQPAGLGLHYAAEVVGATVIPAGLIDPVQQLQTMEQLGVTALAGPPEALTSLAAAAEQRGINSQTLPVSTVYVINSRLPDAAGMKTAACFGADVVNVYAVDELIGPGIAGSCPAGSLHIQEDYFYPEIIDPLTGAVKAGGETGELVLTTLSKEAMPVLRYRTGQSAALERSPCPCGRTLVRLVSG